jgi:uncharacterized cupredoxin-like copper-binding protein
LKELVMMRRLLFVLVAAAGLLVFAACGDDDTSAGHGSDSETRTVEIDMVDIAFEPDTLEVTEGETVRFVFTNAGVVAHEAFVGDQAAQADHEEEMRDAEHGGHGEESEDAITVEPGDTGELTYTFDEAGSLEVGCHQEGHYEAGMKISVEVV